jgi:hypothetical protein
MSQSIRNRRQRPARGGRRRRVAVGLATTVAALAGTAGSAWASGTTPLSYTQPDRLVQSAGNLYWTANSTTRVVDGGHETVTSTADVYRASKDNVPGDETVLYQESRSGTSSTPSVQFGAITYALVGGTWYGYFVANYPVKGTSKIERVPLAGGSAKVLATSPAQIGNRDLVTDGSYLYWADARGIRRLAVGGGAVKTLVSGTTFAHVGLDGSSLFYTSGNLVEDVPTSGGAPSTFYAAASTITAMDPPSATDGNVTFGEADGEVALYPGPYDTPYVIQSSGPGINVTSVSLAGNYIVWGQCGSAGCTVDGYDNGNDVSIPALGTPVDVQGDGSAWYWGAGTRRRLPGRQLIHQGHGHRVRLA